VRGFRLFVKLFEALELRREAAFGGRVDDEDDFALEIGEVVCATPLCRGVLAWETRGRCGSREGRRTVLGLKVEESRC
jgi:hypothetical protein